MANALLGFRNNVPGATLWASTAAAGLGASQLKDDTGSPACAWQTTETSGVLTIEMQVDDASWRLFLLSRTNLTATATIRVQVGPREAVVAETPSLYVPMIGNSAAGLTAAGLTFTRSGAALFESSPGVITSASSNAPRFTSGGLLIEVAATNLFTRNDSATASQACGTASTLSTGPAPPYASAVSTTSTFAATGDSNCWYLSVGSLTSGAAYTASVYVFLPSGTPITALSFAWEGSVSGVVTGTADLSRTGVWQRLFTRATLTGTGASAVLRVTRTAGGTVSVGCKQVEAGGVPTSYMHTANASASRAADALSLVGGVAASTFATDNFSVAMESLAPVLPPDSGSGFEMAIGSTVADRLLLRAASINIGWYFGGGAYYGISHTAVAGTVSRHVVATLPTAIISANAGQTTQQLIGLHAPDAIADRVSFFADAGSAFLRAFWLFPTRFTPPQAQAFADTLSTLTGATTFDSGTIPAGVVPGYAQAVVVAPSAVLGRGARITLSDPANTDGFLNIPLVYAGAAFQPLTNIGPESSFGRDDATDEVASRGGQEFPLSQWVRRRWDVSLAGVRGAETWSQVAELDRVARTGANLAFVPDPADANIGRAALLGRGKPLSDITYPLGTAERRGYKIRFTERL